MAKQSTVPFVSADTIQRMIANLPAKRVSRKVFSPYEDFKSKTTKVSSLKFLIISLPFENL